MIRSNFSSGIQKVFTCFSLVESVHAIKRILLTPQNCSNRQTRSEDVQVAKSIRADTEMATVPSIIVPLIKGSSLHTYSYF